MELEGFSKSLSDLADSLSDTGLESIMTQLGVAAKKDLTAAVKVDLGGYNKFSGWKRAPLTSGFEHTGRGEITVRGKIKGPWLVAEQGRSSGSKHGATRPKYTFTDGAEETASETARRLKTELDKLFKRFL
jgi:hypothetical protein